MSYLLYFLKSRIDCFVDMSMFHFGSTAMKEIIVLYSLLFILILYVKCEKNGEQKSKKLPLPYFRRNVEELGDANIFETTGTDDPHHLVSFLVKNVREIFDDMVDTPEAIHKGNPDKKISPIVFISNMSIPPRISLSTVRFRPVHGFITADDIMSSSSLPTSTHRKDLKLNENLTLTTLLDKKQTSTEKNENPKARIEQLAKDLKLYTKADKDGRDFTLGRGNVTDADVELSDPRRSCIMCNNVEAEECSDPRNKLITSMMCERDDDLCYSLHTPFGVVERGCFNINHNLTTYVCSCNLCNYISISEMPFMFAKKGVWVGNVIELSRTKRFRQSVFKDMSCLRCEVNTTTKTADMLDSANCLEGNIGDLPVEDCKVDEICAVKALRADGFIWRGCVKNPLYNYWWAVCDHDLCNYDTLVNLYDFIV